MKQETKSESKVNNDRTGARTQQFLLVWFFPQKAFSYSRARYSSHDLHLYMLNMINKENHGYIHFTP